MPNLPGMHVSGQADQSVNKLTVQSTEHGTVQFLLIMGLSFVGHLEPQHDKIILT